MADGVRREERLALARELHDVVAHHVTGIVVQAQAARVVARRHPERLEGSIAGIEEAGSEALTAMRRIVSLLRDTADAAPAGAEPERLDALVRRFGDAETRRSVHLRLPDATAAWPPELTSTVYRIVQESLTNIARHAAHATTVDVTVVQSPADVTVTVTDDAPPPPRPGLTPRPPTGFDLASRPTGFSLTTRPAGFGPAPRPTGFGLTTRPAGFGLTTRPSGFGLVGMRERVEALGGSLDAGPRAPTGWTVSARLPHPTPHPAGQAP